MNNITRNVIQDLLPLYLAGEASADSHALVESYLAQDAELGEWVQQQRKSFSENLTDPTLYNHLPTTLPKELQMKSLEQTKELLRKRAWYMAFAILFTGFTLMFRFTINQADWQITWVWADALPGAVGSAVAAIWCFLLYLKTCRQTQVTNL